MTLLRLFAQNIPLCGLSTAPPIMGGPGDGRVSGRSRAGATCALARSPASYPRGPPEQCEPARPTACGRGCEGLCLCHALGQRARQPRLVRVGSTARRRSPTAFRDTTNFDHIKRHYYTTHPHINPTRIVPDGPLLDWAAPHNRALS